MTNTKVVGWGLAMLCAALVGACADDDSTGIDGGLRMDSGRDGGMLRWDGGSGDAAQSDAPGDGAYDEHPLPGVMEIGVRAMDGSFHPLSPGETLRVVLGASGLDMVLPSLRSSQIDPRAPDPTVTVTVGGIVMASDVEGARVDLESDGTGYVLWDLRVPFQTELCCYVCRVGTIEARFLDASGRLFEGHVDVQLSRSECPDRSACCATADSCPDPSLTPLCT